MSPAAGDRSNLRNPRRIALFGLLLFTIGTAMAFERRLAMRELRERLKSEKYLERVKELSDAPIQTSYPAIHMIRTWASHSRNSGYAGALLGAGFLLIATGGVVWWMRNEDRKAGASQQKGGEKQDGA